MITTLRPCAVCSSMRLTPLGHDEHTITASRSTSWTTHTLPSVEDLAALLDVACGIWERLTPWGLIPLTGSEEIPPGQVAHTPPNHRQPSQGKG